MNNQENKDKKLSKKAKTIITITSISGVALVVLTTVVSILLYQSWLYKRSVQALVNREFETAYIGFEKLRNYKDSPLKKEYAYELYNYASGYKNYEVMIDAIVKKKGEVIAQFDTNGASYIPDRVIDEVSEERYISEFPQRLHYDFTGWDLTYGEYQKDKDAVRFTLTAGFETHQYPISYELNGGSIISSAPTHYSYFDGDTVIPRPQLAGYNFTGYYVNGDESEKILDYVIPSHSSGAVTLTANYEPKTIHIQFDPGEGTLIGPSEGDYVYGQPIDLPSVTPPTYYEFDGWYYGKTKVDSESLNIATDCTVTAHYVAEEYDIIYDLDGGTIDPDAPYTYSYDSDDIYIPFAKKEGHMFTGWIVEETDQGNINYVIPHHSHDDIHLKATYAEYEVEEEDVKCVKHISSSRTITDLVFPKEVDTLSLNVVENELNDLVNIGVEKGHPHLYVEDGFLLHKTETGEKTLMMIPKPTYLGAKSVTIPACDVIGPGVFANNNKIEHLETKSPLKKVKDEAFKNCTAFVDFSNASLVEVGNNSFDGDSNLDKNFLNNNPNLTRIGDYAFAHNRFDLIKLSSNITYVGKEAFLDSIVWHITFDNAPSAIISDDAFIDIDHNMELECRVTNINRAFELLPHAHIVRVYAYGPGEFQSEMLKVNHTVQQIICEDTSFSSFEEEAFKDVDSVKKIVLNGNLETIGESAFENSSVEVIEFNDSSNMKYIGKNAFKNSKLKSIDLSMAEDLIIEEDAFLNCTKLEEIKVNYKTAAYLNAACRGCGLLRNITIKYTGGAIASGVIFKEAYFYDLNAVQYITFENNTEEVTPIHFGSKCFRNCEELIDIKLDGFQVASLDTYVFENCRSFKNSYGYFDNLEYYPVGAFFGCESVEVKLDDTLVIDKYAFVSCHCLGGDDDTVELNPNLERIGIEAFAYTSPDLNINTNKLESEVAELKGGPEDYNAYWYKWDMNFFGTILYKIEE